MAEINMNDFTRPQRPHYSADGTIGLTVQFGDHKPLPDSDYDVLLGVDGAEVLVVLNQSLLQQKALITRQAITGVIDGLLSATNTATEALKVLREKVMQ